MADVVTRGLRTAAKTKLPEDEQVVFAEPVEPVEPVEPELLEAPEPEPVEPIVPQNVKPSPSYTSEEIESLIDAEEKRVLAAERELSIDEYLLTLSSARRRALQNPKEAKRQEGMSVGELAQVGLPTTIKGVVPHHARSLGMTPEEFLQRAEAEGYPIEHFEDVIGRRGQSIREVKAQRALLAFMSSPDRRKRLRGQFTANIAAHGTPTPDPSNITIDDVLPTNKEVTISDNEAGFYGSGPGLLTEGDPIEEVTKKGERGYTVASKLVGDLLKKRELAEMVPIWGQREQGWYDYALYKVKRVAEQQPGLSGQELEELKQKTLIRAVQEIALYKTVGLWTAPIFVPYEITDDGDVRIPPPDEMSIWQALSTNIEIIGMTEDRRTGDLRVVGRQTGALQYAFDLADAFQSGIVGTIERKEGESFADAAVRGVANRRNFVEYMLETKLAEEHPFIAMGLGFIPAVLTPDLFAGFGLAKFGGKAFDYAKYTRLAQKISPELKLIAENRALVATHLKAATEAEIAGDTEKANRLFEAAADADRLASESETRIFREFEPTMRRLDERDARVGERFAQIDQNTAAAQAVELARRLPGTDLGDEFFSAHPSVRKVLLSAKLGQALKPQTRRNRLYGMFSRQGRIGIVDRLRGSRRALSDPASQLEFASREARRAVGRGALLDIEGLDGGAARRLDDVLRNGGTIDGETYQPLSQMMSRSDEAFRGELWRLLKATITDDDVRSEVVDQFAKPLVKEARKALRAWRKGDRVKEAREAIDASLSAASVNNEARAVAAAIEYREVMGRTFKKGDEFSPAMKTQMKKAYAVLELSERAIKFADQLTRNFDVTDKFAQRVARLLDARAEAWAAKTGRAPHSWWDRNIGGVQSVAGNNNYIFKTPKASRNAKINRVNQSLADAGKTIRIDWVGYNSKGQHLFQHVDTATNKPIQGSMPATGERDWDGLSASFSATPQGWGVVSESSGQPRGAFGVARASYGPSPETIEEGLKSRFRQVDEHPAPSLIDLLGAAMSETYLVGDADDVVAWLLENTQSEINKTILEHIRSNVDAMFVIRNMAAEAPGQKLWQGVHRPRAAVRDRDVIEVTGRGFVFTGLSEETIIHELVHNATHLRLAEAFEVWVKQATDPLAPLLPAQLRDVQLFNSFLDVHDAAIPALRKAAEDGIEFPEFMIRPSVRQAPTDPEALRQWLQITRTSISEMIAYGFTNPAYQDVLKSIRLEKESLWTQFTRKLAQLFNLSESDEFIDGLSRVIGLTDELLDAGVVRFLPDTEPQFMAVPKRDRLLGKRAATKAPRAAARAWRRQEAASELGLYSKLEDSAREELPKSVAATDRVMTRKAQPAQPAGPVIDPKTGQPRVNRKTGEVIMKGARPAQEAKYKPGESIKIKVLRALGVTPNTRRWELREDGKVVGTAASREALYESASKRLSRAVATRLAKREQDLVELQADRELAEMATVRNRQHIDEAKARIDAAEADIALLRRVQRSMGHTIRDIRELRTQKMLLGPRSKREVLKGLPALADTGSLYTFTKGIKAEEFELSHLDEFLDDLVAQGRTKVTRDEILEHLRTGRTVVTELQLGRVQPKALKALEARDEAFSKLHEAVQGGRAGPSSQLESQPDWWHRLSQDPYLTEKETLQWTEPEVIDVLSGVRGDVGTRGWVDFIHRGFPHPHNQYGRWIRNRITLDPFSGRAKMYMAPLKRDYARARHAAQRAAAKLNEILDQAGTRFEHVFRDYTHGDQTAAEYLASVRAGYPHAEVVSAVRSFAERIKTLRELLEALGDDVVRGGGDLFTGGRSEPRFENWLEGRIVDDPDPDIDFLRQVNTSGSIPRDLTEQYRDSWARLEAAYPDFPKWENRRYEALDQVEFGRWESYKVSDPQDAAAELWRLAGWPVPPVGAPRLMRGFREFIGQIPAAYVPRTAAQKEALREIGDLWRSQHSSLWSDARARRTWDEALLDEHRVEEPGTLGLGEVEELAPGVTPVGAQPSRGQLALQAASGLRFRLHELKLKAGILHRAPREYAIQDEFLNVIGYSPRRLDFEDPLDPNVDPILGATLDRKLESGAEGLAFIARLRQLPEWASWEKAFFDAEALGGSSPLAPKWDSWRLAGGDNYSNFLIRLDSPLEDSDIRTVASRLNSAAQFGQGLADLSPGDLAAWERLHKKYPPTWNVKDTKTKKVVKRNLDSEESAKAYAAAYAEAAKVGDRYTRGASFGRDTGVLPPGSSIEETSTHLNDWIGRLSDSQFKPKHGSHWDQHNVVVHARTTDRLGFPPVDIWWADLTSSQLAEELAQRYPSQWAHELSGYASGWDLGVTRARRGARKSIAKRLAAQEMRRQLDDELKVIQEARKRVPMWGAGGSSDYLKKQSRLELLDADSARPRKILFVEEIQSDWHQGGRARGYSASEHAALSIKARKDFQDIEAKITELRLARTEASEALDSLRVELGLHAPYKGYRPSSADRVKEVATLSPEAISKFERAHLEVTRRGALLVEAEEKRRALHKLLQQTLPKGPVPEAPFKSTDSWLPLALKRLFKVATKGGYDGIAFTRPELAAGYVQMPAKAAEKYYGQIVPSVASKHAGVPYSATYAVQEGDTLLDIARQQYGDARQIEIILEANRKKLGPDRVDDLLLTLDSENKFVYGMEFELKPGTKLTIPGAHAQKIDIPEAGVNALTNNNEYIDVDPRVGGEVPYIELTPEVMATIMEPQPQFMTTPGAPPRPPPLTGQRALTEFLDDGRAVIQVFEEASDKGSDASVIIRQVGQILRRDLDASDFASIVNWLRSHHSGKFRQLIAGANKFEGAPEQIIDDAEDVFAEAFENYVRFNVAPSPELEAPFKELRQGVARVYGAVKPEMGARLSAAARSQLDAMLAESTPSQAVLPTAIEWVKRNIIGSGPDREVMVFDVIAEEARRLGISTKSGDDWLEEFKTRNSIQLPKPMKSQLFGEVEVEVIDADMLLRLQKKLSDEVVGVAGTQTPKAPLDVVTRSVEETSPTEVLRQVVHGEKWQHRIGRAAVGLMFGGDAYYDLRKFPPVMRMNITAAVRPIQEAIGAAVRLGLEEDPAQMGRLLGGETLSYREGRPVLVSGNHYFNSTVQLVGRLYNLLEPEQKVFVESIARAVNEMKRTNQSWGAIIGRDPQRDEIIKFMNEMFKDTSKSEYLNAMLRAAGLGDEDPQKVAELFERITYYAGLTSRPVGDTLTQAKLDHSGLSLLDQATAFMREIQSEYSKAQAMHLGVVVAGHGAAELSRNTLVGLGIVLDKETGEGFRRWLNGLSVKTGEGVEATDKYHKFVEAASRLGVDVRPQEEFLAEGYYIPTAVRTRIGDALARANVPPKKEGFGIIASADDELTGAVRTLYTIMKTRMTRGAFMIRQRYFLMNTMDHFVQLALTLGFAPALASTARMFTQNMVVLPGLARTAYVLQRTPGAKELVGPQAIETWRRSLQRGGDKSSQFVGRLFNLSKYRIDVNDVMDGSAKPILIGKKLYSPRDIRRVATEEGIFASFDTRALERNIKAERVATFSELDRVGKKSGKQQFWDAADDVLKLTSDTAEAWSERERLGAMITLMEMGYDPRTAARITIDALYDYAGSMSKADRKWLLNMVLPFWAFQKNANRQVFDALFSPWGAYRMGMIRRAQEHGADILSYLLYDNIVDPYGVDVESLPEEVAQQYWAFRNTIEWGYGSFDTLADDRRQMLEREFGPLDELDPGTKEFLEKGYGGPANVPVGVRRAMSMVFRDKSVVVEDGKVYELNYILREAKRTAALGTAPYVVPRVSKSGLPGWQQSQPMIAVPERMTENVRIWWEAASQTNPDFPTMMILLPDSTINAGMRHLSNVLAAYVMLPLSLLDDIPKEYSTYQIAQNIAAETFPYERAPLVIPLLAELGLAPEQETLRGTKVDPTIYALSRKPGEVIKKVFGATPIHPVVAETLADLLTVDITALPATYDPYRIEMYRQEGYTDEESKRLSKLIPERYYLPPGIASLMFDNTPGLGEMNKFLFDLEARPLERVGTRSKMVRVARAILGVQTAEYRPSRVAGWEETKRQMPTATPPR